MKKAYWESVLQLTSLTYLTSCSCGRCCAFANNEKWHFRIGNFISFGSCCTRCCHGEWQQVNKLPKVAAAFATRQRRCGHCLESYQCPRRMRGESKWETGGVGRGGKVNANMYSRPLNKATGTWANLLPVGGAGGGWIDKQPEIYLNAKRNVFFPQP